MIPRHESGTLFHIQNAKVLLTLQLPLRQFYVALLVQKRKAFHIDHRHCGMGDRLRELQQFIVIIIINFTLARNTNDTSGIAHITPRL